MLHNLYKQRGETPLECLQRFKFEARSRGELKDEKLAYMGRLDPMAEGVLLVATGEDIKKKDEFLKLDKEYDFTALFGFATDTYDILGKIMRVEKIKEFDENYLRKIVSVYEGEREQQYPPYSSKTVSGPTSSSGLRGASRAMHEWARMEGLDQIDIPFKKIKIYKINFAGLQKLASKELLGRLLMDISKVKGDFRQHDALVLWKEMLTKINNDLFIGRFSAHVSSGTYVRSIVNDLGNTLGLGACALSIVRTRVGEYLIENSIK
jgi:tRNA pseudouridine55 synthase